MKLVVLASGRGTNFAAIANAVARGEIPGAEILALVSNKPAAPAIDIARTKKIPIRIVDWASFRRDRSAYEAELTRVLETLDPDLICLAGYMLILGKAFVKRWAGKIVNIHPSLLPDFPGLQPQKQALEAGRTKTGCTVHWVTEEVDAGAPIAQGEIPILAGDTPDKIAERLLPVEHETYVRALQILAKKQQVH